MSESSSKAFWDVQRKLEDTASQRAAHAAEAVLRLRERVKLGLEAHGGGEIAASVARQFATNRQYIYVAMRVHRTDSGIFDEVKKGVISLREAVRLISAASNKARPKRSKPRLPKSRDVTCEHPMTKAKIERTNTGYRLAVTAQWRNQIAASMADEREFEMALQAGLVIHMNEGNHG